MDLSTGFEATDGGEDLEVVKTLPGDVDRSVLPKTPASIELVSFGSEDDEVPVLHDCDVTLIDQLYAELGSSQS